MDFDNFFFCPNFWAGFLISGQGVYPLPTRLVVRRLKFFFFMCVFPNTLYDNCIAINNFFCMHKSQMLYLCIIQYNIVVEITFPQRTLKNSTDR